MTINQPVLLLVEIVLFALALGQLVPIAVLFVECIAALFPRNQKECDRTVVPRPKIDILVPAHDEAAGISATLQSLLPQLMGQDRLIVIADNCNDETASVARTDGALVVERHEPDHRGKGYALEYGLQFIAENPPEVVVMVDADCIVHPGAIAQITRMAAATARPVQAVYLLAQPPNPAPKHLVSTLAFMVKNLVRPKGLELLGLPCLLTGTGMAFPWSVIRSVPLPANNIVEDMQLAVDLAIAGHPPKFCLGALVTGMLPQRKHAAKSQRQRWEHGHLQTMLKQVPRLLRASVEQKRFDLLAIALDLCVPPLSLLVMIWAVAIGGSLLAKGLGASWLTTKLLAMEGLLIFISIMGAWSKFGRAIFPMLTILVVPLYMLWKIPLYLTFLVQPQTKWIRTERDAVDAPKSS